MGTTPCRALANDAHAIALITSRSVCDSMYVALALRLDTRVITADERFFHALQSFSDLAGSMSFSRNPRAAPRQPTAAARPPHS